jgi:hypothetical protein
VCVFGGCILPWCLPVSLSLFPSHPEVNNFALFTMMFYLTHHRSTTMGQANHGLKPLKLWAKISLSPWGEKKNWHTGGTCYSSYNQPKYKISMSLC